MLQRRSANQIPEGPNGRRECRLNGKLILRLEGNQIAGLHFHGAAIHGESHEVAGTFVTRNVKSNPRAQHGVVSLRCGRTKPRKCYRGKYCNQSSQAMHESFSSLCLRNFRYFPSLNYTAHGVRHAMSYLAEGVGINSFSHSTFVVRRSHFPLNGFKSPTQFAIAMGSPANSSISRAFQLSPIAITSSRAIPLRLAHSFNATPFVTPRRKTSRIEKSRDSYSVSASVNPAAIGSADSCVIADLIGRHPPVYSTWMGFSPFRQSVNGETSAIYSRFRRKYPPRRGSLQSTVSKISCRSRGRTNTTPALARNSAVASSTFRAVSLGNRCC